MDSEQIAGLTAEMKGQLWFIEKVDKRLKSRVEDGLDTPGQLDSVAYQIHNLYCSVEDLLKFIANTFENNMGASGGWHRILLLRMSQPVAGIRPALLSEEFLLLMDKLRSFRHLVRHTYGMDIELAQLRPNIDNAVQLYPLIERDVNDFLAQLTEAEDG